MPKTIIPVLIALLLSLATLPAQAVWEQPKLGYQLNELSKPVNAPNFTLEDMDEYEYDFSEYRGKVVLLNFWASWCPPCRREMPSMERLYRKYQDKDFSVVAVNQMEDEDKIFAFTGTLETQLTFNILLDTQSTVSQDYDVRGLPTSYLIDKEGRIRYRAVGGREFDHPKVEKIIQGLMAE